MDWVKAKGDANKVEDALTKRINEIEKNFETCQDTLDRRIHKLSQEMEISEKMSSRHEQRTNVLRTDCDLLQQQYCKVVATMNTAFHSHR